MNFDYKSELSKSLKLFFDEPFNNHSFKRRKNATTYLRNVGSVKQKARFYTTKNPKYASGVFLHIIPRIEILYPDVNKVALEMVNQNEFLLGSSIDTTIATDYWTVLPSRKQEEKWYIRGEKDFEEKGEILSELFQEYVIPFFNSYTTVEQLLEGYQTRDKRFHQVGNNRWHIFIIAAYLYLNDPRKAKEVLEENLGQKAIRKRYSTVFDYVNDF